jgi:hypothetical protein
MCIVWEVTKVCALLTHSIDSYTLLQMSTETITCVSADNQLESIANFLTIIIAIQPCFDPVMRLLTYRKPLTTGDVQVLRLPPWVISRGFGVSYCSECTTQV